MQGSPRIANWQDKAVRKLESLQYRTDFQTDINSLNIEHEDYVHHLIELAKKYKLVIGAILPLDHYVKTGKIEASRAITGMSIIDERDETAGPADNIKNAQFNYITERFSARDGVKVFIPVGTSRPEFQSFIESTWSSYIELKIGKAERIKRNTKGERDAEVLRMHDSGHKDAAIAKVINGKFNDELIPVDIRKIIERKRDI